MAGKYWLYGFLHRNPELSLRTPENTSMARAVSFNEGNVKKLFDLLQEVLDNSTVKKFFDLLQEVLDHSTG